jgi:hypothetical protein
MGDVTSLYEYRVTKDRACECRSTGEHWFEPTRPPGIGWQMVERIDIDAETRWRRAWTMRLSHIRDDVWADAHDLAKRGVGLDMVARILGEHPQLGYSGFNTLQHYPTRQEFRESREWMLDRAYLVEFHLSRAFLRVLPQSEKFNRRFTSYTWKHIVERWAYEYISNGSLIVAAISLGCRVKRVGDTPNAWLNIAAKYKLPGQYLPLLAQETAR